MDAVSHWFPPLTNREVLTILLGCAAAIVAGILALVLPFQRRLRAWAAEQGYELTRVVGLSSNRQWWNTQWRVTVRDRSGAARVGTVTFVGFEPFPDRIDVQWEDGKSAASHLQWTAGRLLRFWLFWLIIVLFVLVTPVVLFPVPAIPLKHRIANGVIEVLLILPLLFSGLWAWRRNRS